NWHSLLFAVNTRFLVHLQSARKLVEVHVAQRKVAHDGSHAFGIIECCQRVISAFVVNKRLSEAVLPVINISDIDVEPRQPQSISLLGKERARTLGRRERLIVFPEQEKRLNGSSQGAGEFRFVPCGFKGGDRPLMHFDRRRMLVQGVQGIGFCPKTLAQCRRILDRFGNGNRQVRESLGPRGVDPNLLADSISDGSDELYPIPCGVLGYELTTTCIVERQQLVSCCVDLRSQCWLDTHWNPIC